MGLHRDLYPTGAAKFVLGGVSKEADSSYKPLSIRPRPTDFPTIIFEAEWSESLARLRQDARLWLEKSRGEVKIILLFSVRRTATVRTMIIEKWENRPIPANPPVPANRPFTRSTTRTTPTQIQAITIDSNSNTVNGAPLTLEFQKIFLRQAVPTREHDFWFTAQDLLGIATVFWAGV